MKKILITPAILLLLMSCGQAEHETTPTHIDTPKKVDTQLKIVPPVTHYTAPDHSPMDMVYYPSDYPFLKMAGKSSGLPNIRVIYSRPQKEGRKIFGGLVKYDIPWRLGANESTEIEFFTPATIQNKKIKPGRYILYCIPQETKWTFILNSNLYSWGLQQNRQLDQLQFEAPVEKNTLFIEYFTIAFEKKSDRSADMLFLWDEAKVKMTLDF